MYDGIRIENSDKNSEGFIVETSDGETPNLIDSTMIGVDDYYKHEKEPGFGIIESNSEGIKKVTSLGSKDIIFDGDGILTTEGLLIPFLMAQG